MKHYCPKCKRRRNSVEFSKDKYQNAEALAGWCRDCISKRVKKRRATQTCNGLCIEGRCIARRAAQHV